MSLPELDKNYDHAPVETACAKLWEESGIYKYNAEKSAAETFSVDTPPPYVSSDHLHVGHAMSYAQAEFIVRYQRMLGKNIFYPIGFDDNGLPTERYVEKKHNINKKKITRKDFRALCLAETGEGAKTYEKIWRGMGLSVDWNLRYSTIDEHCQRTAQLSFIDLFNKGLIKRSDEPVLWDTHFETALAQADLETIERQGKMYDVAFTAEETGEPLIISTTRPELLPACVALYCHPEDERYANLKGKNAIVPMFGHTVPVKTSEEVDPAFGTGLMMVCTFGDGEDVKKWKADNLATRLCMNPDGKMNELAGPYAGMPVAEAKSKIAKDLEAAGIIVGSKNITQNVSVAERSGVPVEFMMVPQWFIKVLDIKDRFLKRSEELDWNPEFMKVRLDDWINGLKYDWNISRQRFYGVPFPLWTCDSCGEVMLAQEDKLPVDPAEEACPLEKCPKCGGTHFTGETDVMDTWMTSSLTPLINANWAKSPNRLGSMEQVYPASIRVQGFEIIRTWLFYTLIKSDIHTDSLPWKTAMISGWGLSENGQKISKRDLEKFTDPVTGYNKYNPDTVIEKFGADALRFWAAGSQLGNNLRYNEKDVQTGRKVVVKLWNTARFVTMQLGEDFDPQAVTIPVAERPLEDRWLLNELNTLIAKMTACFEKYDYATARESLEKFFWQVWCDNYLEIVKDKFWHPERYEAGSIAATKQTLWEVLRTVIGLFAPLLPFVSEELYQRLYRPFEKTVSLHVTQWPQTKAEWNTGVADMEIILAVVRGVRSLRTQRRLSQGVELQSLMLDVSKAPASAATVLKSMTAILQAVARVQTLSLQTVADEEGVELEGFEGAEDIRLNLGEPVVQEGAVA